MVEFQKMKNCHRNYMHLTLTLELSYLIGIN